MNRRSNAIRRWFVALLVATTSTTAASQDVPDDAGWTMLLASHVVRVDEGHASRVDYAGIAGERAALNRYTTALSAVPRSSFDRLDKPRQMAFLINTYNAFTIQLILTRYPNVASIRDLGTLFSSPWKARFIDLLGAKVSLDDIEHAMLRAPGRYDDPRVHFALVCASIGCPALREEAYLADRLDAQLDDQARRFLSDRRRNRFDPNDRALHVSKLFDWYGDDFAKGHRGIGSVRDFLARYADQLADGPADREQVRTRQAKVVFTEYDWRLNDVTRDATPGARPPPKR